MYNKVWNDGTFVEHTTTLLVNWLAGWPKDICILYYFRVYNIVNKYQKRKERFGFFIFVCVFCFIVVIGLLGFSLYCVETLALGSRPKQRFVKVWAKNEPRNHISCVGNDKECEGMNPHTPKWASTLGVGVLMDSQIFRG